MHNHTEREANSEKKLLISVILNFSITLAEIIGGIMSNSLSLLSDSFHNLNDTIAILISYIAKIIGKKPKNKNYTFGYKRFEIIAALINTIFLFLVAGYLTFEGIKKIFTPELINGSLMLWIAIIGLLGNLFTVFLLFKESKDSINIKAMFVHIITDTLSSIAIIIGALIIIKYKFYIIDAIFTLSISGYIVFEGIGLIRKITEILLQKTPENYDTEKIKEEMERKFLFVENIHEIHIWTTDGKEIYFDAHVALKEKMDKEKNLDDYIDAMEKFLKTKYKISHCLLQLENSRCLKRSIYA